MRNVNTLVTVAGHATYLESVAQVPADPTDESNWALQGFQQGEVPIYLTHMRRGAELVAANPVSTGIMSGGRTRPTSGPWSEGQSYFSTAERYGFWQEGEAAAADVQGRFHVEKYARDSLENVLYSVMFYRHRLGRMPLHVVMVGWGVKQPRFEHHAQTLGIPEGVFNYEAVPLDAYGNTAQPQDMPYFEDTEARTLEQWQGAPLGDSGSLLAKRNARNPHNITPPYTWAEYVGYAQEAGWQPCQEILAAAAIEGSYAA